MGRAPYLVVTTAAVVCWACFTDGASGPDAAVCPANLQPTFSSINSEILGTSSCGTNGTGCHSHQGSMDTGNGLDFSTDAYHALLGADGGGAVAFNISGDAGRPLRRVVPGDPANSFLVIKLSLTSHADPQYGSGMPLPTPGSVCPATLQTIEQWIDAGAPNN
jgi:hypothetical protein